MVIDMLDLLFMAEQEVQLYCLKNRGKRERELFSVIDMGHSNVPTFKWDNYLLSPSRGFWF